MLAETVDIQEQLQQKWAVLWGALSIGLLMLYMAWRQGLFKPFEVGFLPIVKGIDVLRGFGLFLFIQLLLLPFLLKVTLFLTEHELSQIFFRDSTRQSWINLLMVLGGFLGVLVAYVSMTSTQRQQLWKQTEKPWYVHLGIGFIACAVSYPLVLAFSNGLSLFVWYVFHCPSVEQIAVQNIRHAMLNPLLFDLTATVIVTLVPLTEEFLFRGLLQSWLKHKFHHPLIAIALSSLVFALFHYSSHHGITNIELLSSLFALSCMLGYIYERQRSLWAPVFLHSIFNFTSIMMLVHHFQ